MQTPPCTREAMCSNFHRFGNVSTRFPCRHVTNSSKHAYSRHLNVCLCGLERISPQLAREDLRKTPLPPPNPVKFDPKTPPTQQCVEYTLVPITRNPSGHGKKESNEDLFYQTSNKCRPFPVHVMQRVVIFTGLVTFLHTFQVDM